MLLEDWAERNGTRPRAYEKEGYARMMTVVDRTFPDRAGLFRLADYVVTCVSGGTIWLAPRRPAGA